MEFSTIRLFRLCGFRRPHHSLAPNRHYDTGLGERQVPKKDLVSLPVEASPLAPTVEPLEPTAFNLPHEPSQASGVSIHAEVVDVALHAPRERLMLLLDWQVPMISTPRTYSLYGPRQARTPGLARHRPTPPTGPPPIPAEPEEVEGRGTPAFPTRPKWSAKVQQPSLLWVRGKSKALHPFAQRRQYTLRVVPSLKPEDTIIRIAH